MHPPDHLHFGRFELRTHERQLRQDGCVVALGARAFDLLLALIERRDRLVSKAELLDVVWSGLVVEEANLPVQVSALRKLIGSHAIATVPGRGYRFVAALDADVGASTPMDATRAAVEHREAPSDGPYPLPTPLVALLGRDQEIDALADVVRHHRMVTVVGAGGIGKTALALAAAHVLGNAYRDGTCWVDLTSITAPGLVAVTLAQALGFPTGHRGDSLAALAAALKPLQVLVVLDNAEHVIEAVAQVANKVLGETSGARLLVTSQVPTKIEGERLFRLDVLEVPPADTCADKAMAFGSVAMFVDQCQAVDRRFKLSDANVRRVINLCLQLDGLPLAIKLAAARLPLLGLHGLETRLQDPLEVLVGANPNAPVRQRTLGATLDWSHGLLSAREQAVFRRMAVFVGGFTLELAVTVASDEAINDSAVIDSLAALVDRSLVVADGGDQPRYRLLESTREYATGQLRAADELLATQQRHAHAMTAVFETAEEAFWSTPDMTWLDKYGPELGNARVALDWCVEHDIQSVVALTGSAASLFQLLGLLHEYRHRFEAVEPHLHSGIDPKFLARYWMTRSLCLWRVDHRLMLQHALKAEQLYRAQNDSRGLGLSLYCAAASQLIPAHKSAAVLAELASLDLSQWPARIRGWVREAEFQILLSEGRFEELLCGAQTLLGRKATEAPGDMAGLFVAWLENWMVIADLRLGNVDRAVCMARAVIAHEGLDSIRRHHIMFIVALGSLVRGLLMQGELVEARQTLSVLFGCCRVSGWYAFGGFSELFVLLALGEGRLRAAASLTGFGDAAWNRIGRPPGAGAGFRTRTLASLEIELDASEIEMLVAKGAQLDEEDVCRLTLAG